MRPSPAEVTRTLVRGRLPGTLRIDGRNGPAELVELRHSTDAAGRPLVLGRDGDTLSRTVGEPTGSGDPPVVLSVPDVPPVDRAPSLGCARISGRIHRLDPGDAAGVVHEFAKANPVADLLDVGRGVSVYLVDVDQVRLDHGGSLRDIPVAEYTTAEPDPLHELERDLLLDLADHHAAQVESYFRFLLAVAGVPCCRNPPRAVRLDRYGFVVDLGEPDPAGRTWVRLSFHEPVHCRHELAQLLHPVLFHRGPCPRHRNEPGSTR